MKAVVCQDKQLRVAERADPVPGRGQLLLRVLRCGICGSDLHLRQHGERMHALAARVGYRHFPTPADPVVFGHEFCGEVLAAGPGTATKLKEGTVVCAVPLLRNQGEIDGIGLSHRCDGAYAERVVVQEALAMPVPNGLSPDLAALTEPLAVAWHAVRRAEIRPKETAVVIGCGPVGLAVIAVLKARGVATIVASDYSPGRRALALRCGATRVVDPAVDSPYAGAREQGFLGTLPDMVELGVSTREKLGRLPVPWHAVWEAVDRLGLKPRRPVIFECVGVPKVLQSIIDGAPLTARVVVVGVCMQPDAIEPSVAINKEIELRFVLGYSALEYRQALHLLAEGRVDARPLLTGVVGLDGVANAFETLGDPERHAKILIDPARAGALVEALAA